MPLPSSGVLSLLSVFSEFNDSLTNRFSTLVRQGAYVPQNLANANIVTVISTGNRLKMSQFYGALNVTNLTSISTSRTNFNLYNAYVALNGVPTLPVTISITINAGVIVGSTTSSTAAFTVGQFPTGSKIYVINNGSIQGSGGAGGGVGASGGAGGNAFDATATAGSQIVVITNTGTIYGGGGGGGGGINGTPGTAGTTTGTYVNNWQYDYWASTFWWVLASEQWTILQINGAVIFTINGSSFDQTYYNGYYRGKFDGYDGYDNGALYAVSNSTSSYPAGTGGAGGGGGAGGTGIGYNNATDKSGHTGNGGSPGNAASCPDSTYVITWASSGNQGNPGTSGGNGGDWAVAGSSAGTGGLGGAAGKGIVFTTNVVAVVNSGTILGSYGPTLMSIDSNTTDYNLLSTFTTQFGAPAGAVYIQLTVGAVTVGSSAAAALTVGSFPTGSRIFIINNGDIRGAGGAGGAAYAAGAAGTVAIDASGNTVTVTNNGTIYGGGGGGGGGISGTSGTAGTTTGTYVNQWKLYYGDEYNNNMFYWMERDGNYYELQYDTFYNAITYGSFSGTLNGWMTVSSITYYRGALDMQFISDNYFAYFYISKNTATYSPGTGGAGGGGGAGGKGIGYNNATDNIGKSGTAGSPGNAASCPDTTYVITWASSGNAGTSGTSGGNGGGWGSAGSAGSGSGAGAGGAAGAAIKGTAFTLINNKASTTIKGAPN